MKIILSGASNMGNVRTNNEDSFIVSNDVSSSEWTITQNIIEVAKHGVCMVVADGMGGEVAGELASDIAIKTIQNHLQNRIQPDTPEVNIIQILNESLIKSHERIIEKAKISPEYYGMGTTATICYINNNKLYISWVGDSRVYRYSTKGRITTHSYYSGNLEILTNDHSQVWESVLSGRMNPEQARVAKNSNIITQSLGDIMKGPIPENRVYKIFEEDTILACSDGLNSMISDAAIESVFPKSDNIEIISKKLIDSAKKAGGHDNITVTMCKIIEGKVFENTNVKTADILHTSTNKVKSTPIDTQKMYQISNNKIKPKNRRNLILLLIALLLIAAGSFYYLYSKGFNISITKKDESSSVGIKANSNLDNTMGNVQDSGLAKHNTIQKTDTTTKHMGNKSSEMGEGSGKKMMLNDVAEVKNRKDRIWKELFKLKKLNHKRFNEMKNKFALINHRLGKPAEDKEIDIYMEKTDELSDEISKLLKK